VSKQFHQGGDGVTPNLCCRWHGAPDNKRRKNQGLEVKLGHRERRTAITRWLWWTVLARARLLVLLGRGVWRVRRNPKDMKNKI